VELQLHNLFKATNFPEVATITAKQCEEAFITGKISITSDIILEAKPGVILKQDVNVVEWSMPSGWCEGGEYTIWGKKYSKLVVRRQYMTELRKFQATFDSVTRKMMTHPFCFAEDGSCDTGEYTIIYQLDKKECPLTLLKTTKFKIYQG